MSDTKNTNSLTKKQKEAVESNSPATIVIAGPGTGKTHILASRIEYLVEKQNISPENILALTFSKSGASSMKERVVKFLGEEGYKITINTFHGFASSLFEEDPEVFEFGRNLKEATDIDRGKIIENIIDELTEENKLKALHSPYDRYFYFKDISNAIKQIKKEGISVEEFKKSVEDWQNRLDTMPDEEKLSSRGPTKGEVKKVFKDEQKQIDKNRELALVYEKYEEVLKKDHKFDYEDMIIRAINGLEKSEDLRHDLQSKYKAILVDEYQDTSGGQNKLFFLLISQDPNIFVVGDDDQAIYRFQGATIENFRQLIQKFPDANIISLEDNFRSPQLLLNAALNMVQVNEKRITPEMGLPDKSLLAHGEYKDSQDISISEFENDMAEHSFLIEKIQELKKEGAEWHDISVITRTNKEQSEISEILRHHGMPVFISSDKDALDEPRVSSLFAMAAACMNPFDNDNLLEMLLHPATPMVREDVWKILEAYDKKTDKSLYSVFGRLLDDSKFSNTDAAQKTYDIIHELSGSHTTKSGAHWFKEVLDKTGFLEWVLTQEEYPYILANIRALTDEAKRIQAGNPGFRMRDIMEHFRSHRRLGIPLKPTLADFAFNNAVQVMTAHKVKGLEYKNVFIVHAVEASWSKKQTSKGLKLPEGVPVPEQDAEDDRRLFYVALTRAKNKVFITYAKTYTRGIDGMAEDARQTQPSLFIEELKKHISYKAIEKEVEDYLVKSLREPGSFGNLEREIVKNIVTAPTYALNPTSFNSFLRCPKGFLYEKILQVPTVQSFSLTYGNAVHWALQRHFQTPQNKRSFENIQKLINRYIDENSTLSEAENKKMSERAKENLADYWEYNLKNEAQPVAVEYRFRRGSMAWEDVRIAGNIDKVSLITGNDVRLVDYKTSEKHKTQNAILGKTQDKKAPDMHRQLMFYKLLAETSDIFTYSPKEFMLDFVEPNVQIVVPVEQDAYLEFKETLKNAWGSIQTLEFLNEEGCNECKYCKLAS
ncbi:MAG: ATP-dependent DNA helicase [Candidatus Spechtbacterales bacterium]